MTLLLLACTGGLPDSGGEKIDDSDRGATDTNPIDTADSSPGDRDEDGVTDADDCDPDDPTIHSGAYDVCGDGVDQDCDGVSPGCRWSGTRGTNTAEFQVFGNGISDELGDGMFVPDADDDGRAELVVTTGQDVDPGGDLALRYFFGGRTGTARGSEADTIIRPDSEITDMGNGADWGDFDADGVPDVASVAYSGGYGVGITAVARLGEVDAADAVHFIEGDLATLINSPYVWRAPGPGAGDALVLTPGGDADEPFGALYILEPPVQADRASDAGVVIWTDETFRDVVYTHSVGDISGTGVGSFGVSASQIPEGDTDIGAVLLFDNMPADGSTLSDADHRIWGGEDSSRGEHYDVTGGADLDGDGYIDVIVTDGQYFSPYYHSIEVFPGPFASDLAREDAQTIVQDDDADTLFPIGVGTGDFDGDGYQDLALGEKTDDTFGAVRVYYGPLSAGLVLSDTADAMFQGSTDDEYAYWTSDGMDFSGDGIDDLIISGQNYLVDNWDIGATFVFFGGL